MKLLLTCLPCVSHDRTTVIIWSKWQLCIWDPTVQRLPVCHREEWSHSGVSPEWRHRGVAHGSPVLRPAKPGWWAARPCWSEDGCSTSFSIPGSFSIKRTSGFNVAKSVCVFLQAFAQNVLCKADVIQATGDAVCIFKELQCLTPRGRWEINIKWKIYQEIT